MSSNPDTPPTGKPGVAARRAALALLNGVTVEKLLLSEEQIPSGLPPEDRARAYRLAGDALRWAGRTDRLLGPYLRQRPPEQVLNLLRLATAELFVHGASPHGVVDAAVTLAKTDPETRRQAGLVNAVLRRVSERPEDWEALPLPTLPKWLRKPLVRAWGKESVAAIEAAHAAGAPLDLTPRDGDAVALAAQVGGTALPAGSVRIAGPVQVTALPGYAEGRWWVQDVAAAIPARVLAPERGEEVLDLCAAPGGKTMQLAAAGARVTALDISEARMARVRRNLDRTGLAAEIVLADALAWDGGPFDAVLLDAPCSATGTIRRHPDLPFARDGSGIGSLVAVQSALIDRAVALTRPGGRIVFCTCSLLPEEGEAQVRGALERRPELAVDLDALRLPGIHPDWIGAEGLRLRPDYLAEAGGMDGFFVTCLRRPA